MYDLFSENIKFSQGQNEEDKTKRVTIKTQFQ